MTPYIITIITVAFFASVAQKCRESTLNEKCIAQLKYKYSYTWYVTIVGLILILVAGLRYRVGTDYGGYMLSYNLRASSVWIDLLTYSEPGLGLIAWISRFIKDDYATMFFNAALVTITLNVRTIAKYSEDFFVGILLYIFIGAWHGSFNGIRQYLAAAVLFCGHRYIVEKKFWKYMLVVFVASCFHTTALIMIPVYFVMTIQGEWKSIITIIVSSVVLRYSYDFLFALMSELKGNDQSGYEYMQTDVSFFRILVAFAPVILIMLCTKAYRNREDNVFYFRMTILNAAFMFAMSGSAYLARVGIYTDIFATIAMVKCVKGFPQSNRRILKLLILALYFAFWFYEVSTRETLNNFQWIFERI